LGVCPRVRPAQALRFQVCGKLRKVSKVHPPPTEKPHLRSSFFVDQGRITRVVGTSGPFPSSTLAGELVGPNGALLARRMKTNLIEWRDKARGRVLQSQNEGWPIPDREKRPRHISTAPTTGSRFATARSTKKTFGRDQGDRAPRFPAGMPERGSSSGEDPDAMMVMGGWGITDGGVHRGGEEKAPIMLRDVVGRSRRSRASRTAEEGLVVSLRPGEGE